MADLDIQKLTWGLPAASGVNTPDTTMPVVIASEATAEVTARFRTPPKRSLYAASRFEAAQLAGVPG